MNPGGRFSELAFRIARAANYAGSLALQNYTFAERMSLLRARRPRGHETKIFNFRASNLSEDAYQISLRAIFFKGDYRFEAETDSPAILDCGANIGLATLFFKHLYPKARISSFEADPTTASVLRKNVEQNHLQDVSVYNLLLTNTEGDHAFYTAGDVAGGLGMSMNPNRPPNSRQIMVKAGKLSDYIDGPIDFLKLDVEGAEWEVMDDLKSSGKLSLVRRMVIEYHHKIGGQPSRLGVFLSFLEGEGFEYQISAEGCEPITLQGVYQDVIIGACRRLPG